MIAAQRPVTLAAGQRAAGEPRPQLCVAAAGTKTQGEQQAGHGAALLKRRQLGLRLLSAAAALAVLRAPPPAEAAAAAAGVGAAALPPYQRGLALEYGLTQDGRIRRCPSDANPNCVSTTSTNAVRHRLGPGRCRGVALFVAGLQLSGAWWFHPLTRKQNLLDSLPPPADLRPCLGSATGQPSGGDAAV